MNRPRGKPFQPDNTFGRGRPKGSRNRSSRAARNLLEQHYEHLMAKQLKAAYDGDAKARQWCLEQIQRLPAPSRKLKLPRLETFEDLDRASEMILEQIGQGHLSPKDGTQLTQLLEQRRKLLETQQLVPRMDQLEQIVKSRRE